MGNGRSATTRQQGSPACAGRLEGEIREIANDLDHLLSAIVGFGAPAEKALRGTRLGEDLAQVVAAAERATELTRSLLLLAESVDDGRAGEPPSRQPDAAILVIDDDDGVRQFISFVLRRAGYAVVSLADGTGVEAELSARRFDLVITDLMMPRREGLGLIQAIARLCPDLPVVAVSGAFGGGFLHAAQELGAVEILLKPLHPDELLRCVRKTLAAHPAGCRPR